MPSPEEACRHKRYFRTAMLASRAAEYLNGTTLGPGRVWYQCPHCDGWHFKTPNSRRERETVKAHRNAARNRNKKGAAA